MSFIEVKINNWGKYNIRSKDYKNPWWFALNNRILEDVDVYRLSDAELRAWIYILSQASKTKSDTVDLDLDHATRVCKVSKNSVFSLIEKFSKKSILSASGQESATIRPPQYNTEQYNTEQNTYVQTKARTSVSFDFENLYASYPRKQGKSQGLKKLQNQIKTQDDFDKARLAIENYTNHCKQNSTDKQYIKMFSTFANEWQDWLDPETGTAVAMKKKTRGIEEILAEKEARNANGII